MHDSRPQPRSPMSLVVLALLYEQPMHPYRMHKLIEQRGKDRVVNIAQRNSVQQTINRLQREGLITEYDTEKHANYPARVVFDITESGSAALFDWLEQMLSCPRAEYPRFPAALAFIALISPDKARSLLEKRRDAVNEQVAALSSTLSSTKESLSRVFLIEDEYALALHRAELTWLDSIIDELRNGMFCWDTQSLMNGEERVSSND